LAQNASVTGFAHDSMMREPQVLPTLSPQSYGLALLALLGVPAIYVAGVLTGFVTFIGYEARAEKLIGATRTSVFPVEIGIPVWLNERQGIAADFDVDARFGAVTLTVAPPIWLRTSLQAATAYVEGRRSGSVLFIAEAPGWYSFDADPTPNGGPRCGKPSLDLKRMLIGDQNCPAYDVSYSVTWRIAGEQDFARVAPRLKIPRPNGMLVTLRLRD
jgi:hypothetical protein